MKEVKVFAHRGASAYAPENTLPAFRLAMEQGSDGIELDIHLTKEGEIVVIHDENLDRTTNGTGLVQDRTLAELQALCADNGMHGFAQARIPTLREVLDLVKPSGMLVNIEIKTGILWYDGIEEKALRLVETMGMQDRVIWSSFNHYSIEKVRQLAPDAQTAYLFSDIICDVEQYAAAHGVGGLHPGLYNVKMEDLLQRYLASGLAVRVWTVNEEADLRWLMQEGADVITNDPRLALELRRSLAKYHA